MFLTSGWHHLSFPVAERQDPGQRGQQELQELLALILWIATEDGQKIEQPKPGWWAVWNSRPMVQQTVLVFEVRTESEYAALHTSSHLVFHHGRPAGCPLPAVQPKQKTEGRGFFGVCGKLWRGTDGLEQRAKGAENVGQKLRTML